MRPIYKPGTSKNVDRFLTRSAWGSPPETLVSAITAARGEGYWLSPEVLRPYLTHSNALAKLTDTQARGSYRGTHALALHQEDEALARSEALRPWAASGAADQIAIDAAAAKAAKVASEREAYAVRRASELRMEEEQKAHAKRLARARIEFDAAQNAGGPDAA